MTGVRVAKLLRQGVFEILIGQQAKRDGCFSKSQVAVPLSRYYPDDVMFRQLARIQQLLSKRHVHVR
jgi:hypothetical protein